MFSNVPELAGQGEHTTLPSTATDGDPTVSMDYITTAVQGPGTPVSVDESLDSTSTDSMSQSVEIDTILDGFDSDTTVSLPQLLHTSEMNQTHTTIVGQIPYLSNQSLCADTTVPSTVTPTSTQGLLHHISPLVRPTVSSDATRSLGCDAPQSTSAVFTGSNLRPSSSHGLQHTVSAVQTRSKTATSRPPPVPIQHEEPSSSQSHMRETTNSRHIYFDDNSDDDQQVERPTSTQRLNIGNRYLRAVEDASGTLVDEEFAPPVTDDSLVLAAWAADLDKVRVRIEDSLSGIATEQTIALVNQR